MVRTLGPIATLALATGCAAVVGVAPSSGPAPQPVTQAQSVFAPRAVSPETCDTRARVRIRARGGAFRVPRCAGWNGVIAYPPPRGPSRWLVTTSVTHTFGVPAPPSGTAIFYMQTTLNWPEALVTFLNSGVTDTVTSSQLTSSHTYTLMVYNLYRDDQCPSGGCGPWILNIGSPEAGKHSITFSSPLNGAAVLPGTDTAPVWQFIRN
jgi:hypothetical protein